MCVSSNNWCQSSVSDHHNILSPERSSSAVCAPCPLLPPDHELYPGFPVVFVLASHPACLESANCTPPPPPAIIKGVLFPLTTNVPPPPPEPKSPLLILPSCPTSIWMISSFDNLNVPIILAPLPRYWALFLYISYPPAAPIASIL